MSSSTQLVSYKIMMDVYQRADRSDILQHAADLLRETVPAIQWCAIYCLNDGSQLACCSDKSKDEHAPVLRFPISWKGSTTSELHIQEASPLSAEDMEQLQSLADALGGMGLCCREE
ncbi:hypothetical protein [Alkalicoccus chagannorensis]|uniref:hypothetical protein n=1 Tax=Alkalicoccus chagannorensis TaxID=427072 RepID=UPI00047EB67F|nr:hypothetical protein [Alkalicoccus chagannorensis]